jgi:hypothetical protein
MTKKDALHQSREPAEAVNRRVRRERVHAAQAAAAARLAGTILTIASDDSRDSAGRSLACSAGLGSDGAASLDGDGGGGGGRAGVDVLETAGGEGCAVCADGEGLEVGHGFVAGGGGVDGEDHAFAAVDAVLLFAVEPWGNG